MRVSCYKCVRKHLGEAAVYESEIWLGYPDFDVHVIGCLSHASMECVQTNPELADCIREWRLAWEDNKRLVIPYEGLSGYIRVCEAASEIPALPEELKYKG